MKRVLLSDYFDIESTLQKDKMHFTVSTKSDLNAVPFLGRSGVNNGIVDYVQPINGLVNSGKTITIALDGSTGSTFYQHHAFCSGQNIWLLKPKVSYFERFNPKIALFLITTIRQAVKSYTYNLSLTKTRLLKISILLPLKDDLKVDVDYIENEMNKLRNINLISKISNNRL